MKRIISCRRRGGVDKYTQNLMGIFVSKLPHPLITSAMPMDKRRWRRTESSDAGTATGDSSSNSNSSSSCFNNNRPIVAAAATSTKSILKSSSESASAAVPSADCATTSSSPRLGTRFRHATAAAAAAHSAVQRRQHSIDAKLPASSSGGRAVTFFLESESSESSFAGRADEPTMTTEESKAYRQHHRLSRHWSPRSQQNGAFRRTSLPVQSNSARQNLLLQSQVNSARGILMDLLATNRGDLSPDVAACLKAVTALLNPASPTHQQTSAVGCCANVGGVPTNLSLTELGVPSVVESPYSGEVHIALTSKARVSNITFSTVTSATGLPTIAAEPSRPRSSSYWKPSHAHTVQNHHGGHNGGGTGLVTNISNSLPQRINFDEDEDGLNDRQQQQQHDDHGANDVAKKQFHKVGDGQRQQQQRHHHQRRPVNEDGRDTSWQGVQQQQLQQQQRLLNSREGTKEEEEDEEREEAALATTSSSKLNETTGAKVHSAAFTNGGTRRVGIDSDQLHRHDRVGAGGGGGGGGVHHQQSSGSGDNTSLSSVATTTTTTTTTTAPYAHHAHDHAQSVDSDDMTGQPKSGFPPSTSSHRHKAANAAGVAAVDVVGQQQAKHHSKATTPSSSSSSGGAGGGDGGRKSKSPRPIGPDEEYCNSEQSSSSFTAGGHLGAQHGLPAVYKTVNGTTFDRAELERDPTLGQVQEWSFPIFRLAEKHKRTVLSRLTYAIFKEADLFRTFKISYAKFFNYFHALESGYWDIPYHNRIHAADVLHGTYYLTCHPVHAFCGYHSSELEDEDELEDEEDEEEEEEEGEEEEDHHCDSSTLASCSAEQLPNREQQQQPSLTNHQQNQRTTKSERPQQQQSTNQQRHFGTQQTFDSTFALPLAQSMSPLELMALYTAAAMHDYDHPGRTNAFLVASEDRKAILYNDRSVLENHHAAESWRLLNQAQNQFIENLDSAETKRFRYLVLEYILATDLKQHFDIIMQFNERVSEMDLSNESDRVLISLMLIKFADINSPAKPYSLHRQWTERICQEFYEQGHEEKKRQMPVSPYMDRNEPAVAKLQDSFIAHIVNPLAIALNEAGLFPVLPGLPESELIINLKHNHQKWLHQIEAEQCDQEKEDSTASASSTAAASGGGGSHKARSNNIGAGGEAEMALNSNGGVKLPMFNNNFSSSVPLVAAKQQQHKGSGSKSGAVVGYRARAATTTTTTAAPPMFLPLCHHSSPFVSHGAAGGVVAGGAVRSASMSSREHAAAATAAAGVDDAASKESSKAAAAAAAAAAATTGKIVG